MSLFQLPTTIHSVYMEVIKICYECVETRPMASLLHLVSKTNNTEYKCNWADINEIFQTRFHGSFRVAKSRKLTYHVDKLYMLSHYFVLLLVFYCFLIYTQCLTTRTRSKRYALYDKRCWWFWLKEFILFHVCVTNTFN